MELPDNIFLSNRSDIYYPQHRTMGMLVSGVMQKSRQWNKDNPKHTLDLRFVIRIYVRPVVVTLASYRGVRIRYSLVDAHY